MKSLVLISFLTVSVNFLHAQSDPNWFSETVDTRISAESIWRVWTDVENWGSWDTGLQKASLQEEWGIGAKGILMSNQGRRVKFRIVEYVEGERYTFRIKLPLASFTVSRFLEAKGDLISLTHEVRFKGLLGGLFARSLGKEFREKLPEVVNNVRKAAESQSGLGDDGSDQKME